MASPQPHEGGKDEQPGHGSLSLIDTAGLEDPDTGSEDTTSDTAPAASPSPGGSQDDSDDGLLPAYCPDDIVDPDLDDSVFIRDDTTLATGTPVTAGPAGNTDKVEVTPVIGHVVQESAPTPSTARTSGSGRHKPVLMTELLPSPPPSPRLVPTDQRHGSPHRLPRVHWQDDYRQEDRHRDLEWVYQPADQAAQQQQAPHHIRSSLDGGHHRPQPVQRQPHASALMPPSHPLFKSIRRAVPEYDGTPTAIVESWIETFLFMTECLSNKEKFLLLCAKLTGRAATWLQDQQLVDPLPRGCPIHIWLSRLEEQFAQSSAMRKSGLTSRRQQRGESALVFCADLQHLLMVYDSYLSLDEQINWLKSQMHPDYAAAFAVRCPDDATWSEAVTALASAMDFTHQFGVLAEKSGTRSLTVVSPSSSIQSHPDKDGLSLSGLDKKLDDLSLVHQSIVRHNDRDKRKNSDRPAAHFRPTSACSRRRRRSPGGTQYCWTCGGRGHTQVECPSPAEF